jgi:RNA recognition motif-containing protein
MNMKSIYVGNLPFSATEEEILNLFSPYGTVHGVKLVSDRETGRARGFGFVEMEDAAAASAISALNGKEVGGRSLRINEARERERAPRQERNRY